MIVSAWEQQPVLRRSHASTGDSGWGAIKRTHAERKHRLSPAPRAGWQSRAVPQAVGWGWPYKTLAATTFQNPTDWHAGRASSLQTRQEDRAGLKKPLWLWFWLWSFPAPLIQITVPGVLLQQARQARRCCVPQHGPPEQLGQTLLRFHSSGTAGPPPAQESQQPLQTCAPDQP